MVIFGPSAAGALVKLRCPRCGVVQARARAADMTLLAEGEVSCCYARSDKYWVTDPQGIAWEQFHTLDSIPVFGASTAAASGVAAVGATTAASPACCPGNDQACGKSDPEGISGTCDLTIVNDQNVELYDVCTYRQRCQPFQIEPCKPLDTCIVEDKVGSASCVTSAGKTNRQPCSFANECADGFTCFGDGDAGTCHQVCLFPGSVHPFDAGVEEGGPGKGGCPEKLMERVW